ncbi:ABC transporter permease [Butyrivibrio sp. AE2015]|uniref:ABC transporter permease n=1 Tax=Butyrivibrio sp. AE2015 TaxID=1280663 RepID=UPI0003B534A1|nr:ABC transporter permease subunit [Butyrivibrio sp. AE2015]
MEVRKGHRKRINYSVFIMAMLGVIFLVVFCYMPMLGIIIGFKDMDYAMNISRALGTSKFVGFQNFKAFLNDPDFKAIMTNTIGLNVLQLIISFPVPIIFALLLNELSFERLKKIVQSVTYFPYFISWVVFGGILIGLLSPEGGAVNQVLRSLHIIAEPIAFTSKPEYFWGIVIVSAIIKGLGWGAVIYIAAIAGIDPSLYDAARIDGAGRFQKTVYVTIPCITGTIVVMLLLAVSGLLSSNFDQIFVLQNPLNISKSEVLDTYIYKIGVAQRRYSFTTAVGLFKSIISLILISLGNFISNKLLGRGLY